MAERIDGCQAFFRQRRQIIGQRHVLADAVLVLVVEDVALGATPEVVLQIFLVEGLLIGGLGTLAGTLLGAALIFVLKRWPFVHLPGDVYFIETLPVCPEAGDFAAVILAAIALCLAAAWYPAWQASRLDPVAAIRRQT